MLLSLLCCYPGGLVLMWLSPKFSQGAKIAISVIFGLITISGAINNAKNGSRQVAGTTQPAPFSPPTVETNTTPRPMPTPKAPPPKPAAVVVPLQTLLAEYKNNEIRADAQYKGKIVQITGTVGDVKKDILNNIYVTLGTGAAFEIPVAQCFFDDQLAQQAAMLNKGSKVTIRGRVDGLMMNVLIHDAEFVP